MGAVLGLGVTHAFAVSTVVKYNPPSYGVFGVLPASDSWPMTVTAPGSGTTFPVTVTLRLVCTASPVGDFTTPLNYITFSSPTLTFTGPGQIQTVNVSANFPSSALTTDVTAGTYAYQVFTDGWGSGITDNGAQINASVSTVFPPPGNPPTTVINTPVDGTVFTYALASLPATISFAFTGTTDSTSPLITSVAATFGPAAGGMAAVPVSISSGLGTATVSASGTFTVSAPGTYVLQAGSTNVIGTGTDTSTYTVVVTVPGPTATIATPVPNASYTYRLGDAPVSVPFDFSAHSYYGGIRTLVAYVDGVQTTFTPAGIGTLDATGTINLLYASAGTHTVSITATDDYGTATANSNFTVNVVAPTPTINITAPANNAVFTIPTGATAMDVAYGFTTTSNNGFVVNSVSAALGATPVVPTTTGLNTATATSAGTLTGLVPGTYMLTATGASAGISVQQSVTFTVKSSVLPPSVVIDSPAANASFTRYLNGPALAIPLAFTGTSNATNGVITSVTATLDGAPLAVTATLNQKVVPASATMNVTAAGTHTIVVTATDAVGTATATQTFTVTILQGSTVSGTVFFDVDLDGSFTGSEFGLAGIPVQLKSSTGQVLGSTTTAPDGTYAFDKLAPGTYTIAATAFTGLTATHGASRTVTVNATNVTDVNIGFMLDFCALQGMSANGYTIGYWKNNLSKAIAGRTGGVQVSAASLTLYTTAIGSLALSPYDNISMKGAVTILGSTSSAPADLLSKQLLASEYNYENAAYFNGNAALTYVFVWWGEYVLSHPTSYSSSYVLWAKDWFDAYNNTHGGPVSGPALLGITCTGNPPTSSTGAGQGGGSGGSTGGSGSGTSCDSGDDHHHGTGSDDGHGGSSHDGGDDHGSSGHGGSGSNQCDDHSAGDHSDDKDSGGRHGS